MNKERYEFREVENELDLNDTDIVIVDNDKGGIISYENACKLLNQQDKEIKELKDYTENTANLIDKLTEDSVFASTQLAIEELEKVKEYNHTLVYSNALIDKFIDNQIKELKKGVD